MGSAERELRRTGLRYALGLRLVVSAVAGLVSLFLEPAREPVLAAVIVLGLNAWNVGYAVLRVRTGGRLWLYLVDLAVICVVCLTQVWTSGPNITAGSTTWVLVAAAITVVSYPWQMSAPKLAVATVVIVSAYLVGAMLARPDDWLEAAPIQAWMLMEAALSYGLYRLVRHGARIADRLVARNERLRRDAAISSARRADEREYLAALHDTASATLLMVGAGVVRKRERWLAEQATRDLEVIRGREDIPAGEVDLLDMLREVTSRTPLNVRWQTAGSLNVPAVVAIALSRCTREALTNVVRHAGVDDVDLRVGRDGEVVYVEVVDAGRGFDVSDVPDHRYGVTRSLVERMARIGGNAEIASEPGAGTKVRLESPVDVAEAGGTDAEIIFNRFLRGLRWAMVAMSLVITFGLDLPKLLGADPGSYPAVTPQYIAIATYTLVAAWVGVALWRGYTATWWRWPLVVLVFAVSVVATEAVVPAARLGVDHWSEADAGWSLVLLLLDVRPLVFVTLIAAQFAVTFIQVWIGGDSAVTFVGAVNATVIVLSYQLAVGMIAAVLRGIAFSAARIARDEEQLRTSEAVAQQLHDDRKDRYASLADTTAPLLAGLASGDLDPGDQAVRRRCSLDAAKMRRLFADGTPDPLLHELQACIELA
ncbi:MAG: ATP-binding protein, partial [Kibdelosporangium sp.]